MKDPARWAAAIAILDQIFAGAGAEPALLNWARGNRFAGSKDRHAIRDLVFDALRNHRFYAALGEGNNGRNVMIGAALAQGIVLESVFNGQGYGSAMLNSDEKKLIFYDDVSNEIRNSIPAWLYPSLSEGERAQFSALRYRAPIDLRVNPHRATRAQVQDMVQNAGYDVQIIADLAHGLRVTAGARGLQNLQVYGDGWFEFQDAGAQRVMNSLRGYDFSTALDYCAGGGGKTLALGAMCGDVVLSSYDINQTRMKDLPKRIKRAGLGVNCLKNDPIGRAARYDLLILDVPCSGSGAWRRNPDGKLRLSETRLHALCKTQQTLLQSTRSLSAKGGLLLYITCSIFQCENQVQITRFLEKNQGYRLLQQQTLPVGSDQDGFYMALLRVTSN